MSKFRMHPLHTVQLHIERFAGLGVVGYHRWLEEKRGTGRSTAQALRAIADAIDNPHQPIDLVDHSGQRGGHEYLANATAHLIREMKLTGFSIARGRNPHGSVMAVTFGV